MAKYVIPGGWAVVGGDMPFTNNTAGTLADGTIVAIDASGEYLMKLPVADAAIAGILIENVATKKTGRVRMLGGYPVLADGTITPGAPIIASLTTGKIGRAKAAGTGVAANGIALTGGADGDKVVVWIQPSAAVVLPFLPYTQHSTYGCGLGRPSSGGSITSTGARLPSEGSYLMKQVIKNVDGTETIVDEHNRTLSYRESDGRLVTMDLGQTDWHYETAMSNFVMGWKMQEGIADFAAPVVQVNKASDFYYIWSKDDVFQRSKNVRVAPGGNVSEISPRLSTDKYTTDQYGLGAFIPTEVEANSDSPLSPGLRSLKLVLEKLRQEREIRVATMYADTAAFDYKIPLDGTTKWNGGTTASDPIANLLDATEQSLQPVTDIIMTRRVWNAFIQNKKVQAYISPKLNLPALPNQPSQLTSGGIAFPGLPPITIAEMKGANETTGALDYIWGNNVYLLCRADALPADGSSIANGYTFRWNGGAVGDGTMVNGMLVRSFFHPYRGPRGGRQIYVTHNDGEKIVSPGCGAVIVGAYA